MTREDFRDWLHVWNCDPQPIEGVNVTGWSIRFVNRTNGRYAYLKTPLDDTEMPDNVVRQICDQLLVPYPDCVIEND